MTALLELRNLTRVYPNGRKKLTVLRGLSYTFEPGKMYAVVGPSGSGKTTMLSLASGLDSPTNGMVAFAGRDVAEIGLGRYRNRHVATVFQSFNLLPYFNAVQSVTSAMEITGVRGQRRQRAVQLLTELGIEECDQRRKVTRLSGGQQQRVAIARAVACDVDVLFADEPTGSLDTDTAAGIIRVFQDLAHTHGKCVIVATHSSTVASASDEVLRLSKGKLQSS